MPNSPPVATIWHAAGIPMTWRWRLVLPGCPWLDTNVTSAATEGMEWNRRFIPKAIATEGAAS